MQLARVECSPLTYISGEQCAMSISCALSFCPRTDQFKTRCCEKYQSLDVLSKVSHGKRSSVYDMSVLPEFSAGWVGFDQISSVIDCYRKQIKDAYSSCILPCRSTSECTLDLPHATLSAIIVTNLRMRRDSRSSTLASCLPTSSPSPSHTARNFRM